MSDAPSLTKTSCWWSHRWTKWKDKAAYTQHPCFGDMEAVMGVFTVQERRCVDCNKLQMRRVRH